MFTGIIEELGTIEHMRSTSTNMSFGIRAKKVITDVQIGDSIAVNGVCLTVTQYTATQFTADVMPETVTATTMSQLQKGDCVNLERAMPANGRFGGHMVAGHVDGVGKIVRKTPQANAVYLEIDIGKALTQQCIQKGSITLDGTSLTIFSISDTTITVSLIPHTYAQTVLGNKQAGDEVNVECDMLGKYIQHFLVQQQAAPTITQNFLAQHGF